jgi:ligand-binding sensor protein
MRRNRGIPKPRPTPRPTLKLVWSVVVVVVPGADAVSEGVGGFVGVESGVIDESCLLVVANVVAGSVLLAEALMGSDAELLRVSKVEVLLASAVGELLVSEVDVLLALISSVRVLSTTTTLLDVVLGTLAAELEELASVMLK